MSSDWIKDVRDFNEQKLPFLKIAEIPEVPTWDDRVYLLASLASEQAELARAFSESNLPEAVDAVLDSIYVQLGILIRCGIPIQECWDDIQRSNMQKLPAAPGTMGRKHRDEHGQLVSMKPDGWKPPAIAEILKQYGWDIV